MDRRVNDATFQDHVARVKQFEQRIANVEGAIAQNNEMTARVEKNTADIVAAWTAVSGGLKVLGWCGTVAKWLGAVGAAAAALWAFFHGTPPKI